MKKNELKFMYSQVVVENQWRFEEIG